MRRRINEIIDGDDLILHKAGLLVGAVVGFVFGMMITAEADTYEAAVQEAMLTITEVSNETTED